MSATAFERWASRLWRRSATRRSRAGACAEMVAALGRAGDARRRRAGVGSCHAADRIASAAMWLVVHETYARSVYLDGRALGAEDFKPAPEGHTGGALNMVPAYAGYLAANALSGHHARAGSWARATAWPRSTRSTCWSAT